MRQSDGGRRWQFLGDKIIFIIVIVNTSDFQCFYLSKKHKRLTHSLGTEALFLTLKNKNPRTN
jgi:hypothetical protein